MILDFILDHNKHQKKALHLYNISCSFIFTFIFDTAHYGFFAIRVKANSIKYQPRSFANETPLILRQYQFLQNGGFL